MRGTRLAPVLLPAVLLGAATVPLTFTLSPQGGEGRVRGQDLPGATKGADVTIMVSRANLEFFAGKSIATRYEFGPTRAKPFFWPLLAPNGLTVTRDWPMLDPKPGDPPGDHPHQKSAWFTYGDVIPEGIEIKKKPRGVEGVDFWSEGENAGRIVCVRVGEVNRHRNQASIPTYNEWRTPDGVKILDETRKILMINDSDYYLYVLDIDLHASVAPITFGDTKEGAFGVRVADSMTEKLGRGRITNADGKVGEKECWGRISAWCDYSGPVRGRMVGVAIFTDPKNPYPSCWHSRAYGLMAANPFGRKKSGFPAMKDNTKLVHLARGEHLKLRFGLFPHTGDVKEGKVAEYYERFTKLPR